METSTLQETVEQHYKKHKPVLEWAAVRKKANSYASFGVITDGRTVPCFIQDLKEATSYQARLRNAAYLVLAYETLPIGANAEDEKRVREGYRLVCDLTTAKPGYFRYAGSP